MLRVLRDRARRDAEVRLDDLRNAARDVRRGDLALGRLVGGDGEPGDDVRGDLLVGGDEGGDKDEDGVEAAAGEEGGVGEIVDLAKDGLRDTLAKQPSSERDQLRTFSTSGNAVAGATSSNEAMRFSDCERSAMSESDTKPLT